MSAAITSFQARRCDARRRPLASLGLTLSLVVVLAAPSFGADDVHLENGRVFEDVIATLTDTHVVIEMAYGRMRLPRAQVARVEQKETSLERFRDRRSALLADPSSTATAWAELARWAWAHGLVRDATETALLAARLDPNVESLDAMLTQRGYERDPDLGWVPRAVAMERRGLVSHRGDWVTPERRAELIARERAERERATQEAERRDAEREARRREESRESETPRGPTANEVALASIDLAREVATGRVGVTLARTSSLSMLHPVFVPNLPLSGGGGFWTGGGASDPSAGATVPGRVSADWEALSSRIPGSRLPLGAFRPPPR